MVLQLLHNGNFIVDIFQLFLGQIDFIDDFDGNSDVLFAIPGTVDG